MNLNDVINDALKLLIEKVSPYMVYLFGSASRGELRNDSDIDIAYISDITLTHFENFTLAQELSDIIGREVDLINLNEASTVFKAQIVGTGKKLYCSDENRKMYFEMRVLKEYALLNEEREVIMKNIKERGNVYGQ